MKELSIDFVHDKVNYQRKNTRGKNELIAKALGLSKGYTQVLDLTAGLCIDAFFLLELGCTVTAVERSPVIYTALADAYKRAQSEESLKEKLSHLTLVHSESLQYLQTLKTENLPEVIYMDPMYPAKKKSALPKGSMQLFRQIVGDDLDSKEVLELALKKAKHRVVVKRPLKAEPLGDKVSHSFEGKMVRYDMYMIS